MINAASIVRLVILVMFGMIVAKVADKKGYYNQMAFFFYGIFAPIIALIHTILLPDTCGSQRQYKGKTLTYSIWAVITAFYSFAVGIYRMIADLPIRWIILDEGFLGFISSLLRTLIFIAPPIFLISVMLGRKYRFSIFAYTVSIVISAIQVLNTLSYLKKEYPYMLEYKQSGLVLEYILFIISAALACYAYVVLVRLAYRYGVKGERLLPGNFERIFILPAGLLLGSIILRVISYCVNDMGDLPYVIGTAAPQILFTVPSLLFLGLFYYHDSIEEV